MADPEVYGDLVLLRGANTTNRSEVIDISGPEPVLGWQNKNLRNDIGTCVLIDGYLYGSDGWGKSILRCIDFKTGEVMWEEPMTSGTVSLTAADNKLIILEENGTLYIAEATPTAYQEISSCDVLEGERKFRMFWTPPVLCNGRIYCRNHAGDLICIDVSK